MSKSIGITLVLLALTLTIIALLLPMAAEPVEQIIVADGASEYSIYVDSLEQGSLSAAEYLSTAIERATGVSIPLVFEKEADGHYLSLCSAADESAAEGAAYTIRMDDNNVVLGVAKSEDLFAAVKVIADRWLQEGCGLREGGELYISEELIRQQLSGLPLVIQGTIKIMTQNLRYNDDPDGNSVRERSERFLQLIIDYKPDLIGTQEATSTWMSFADNTLSDAYESLGCSGLGPESTEEEWTAILYRKDRFTLLDSGTFWLSDTPDEPATKLSYEGHIRICTWALLQDRQTDKEFLFANTHLQNGGAKVYGPIRAEQAQILLDVLRQGADYLDQYPCFLTGDFNGSPKDAFYPVITQVFRDAQLSAIKDSSNVDYTFHNYGKSQLRLDYCFHTGETTILNYAILDRLYGGYVSDHYSVMITALIN